MTEASGRMAIGIRILFLYLVLPAGHLVADMCPSSIVGGDTIGIDSTFTNETGGFSSVRDGGMDLGHPAFLASFSGHELLTNLRTIVFGIPSVNNNLKFDQFDYRFDVWSSEAYFAGADPIFQFDLANPVGLEFISEHSTRTVPNTTFGSAGVGGNNEATFELIFDLQEAAQTNGPYELLSSPMPAGDWVFGFQSYHSVSAAGSLRVSGSIAPDGPLPLFSREGVVPRGVLGGQNPENIVLRWGISLTASLVSVSGLDGDYNGDGTVDAADYTIWRDSIVEETATAGYYCWRKNYGAVSSTPANGRSPDVHLSQDIPEPRAITICTMAILLIRQRKPHISRRFTPTFPSRSVTCMLESSVGMISSSS